MRAQDTVPTLGRRVLMDVGVGAASVWRFTTSNYPDEANEIDLVRGNFRITPGCVLQVQITYLPSGGVEGSAGDPDYGFGRVHMDLTWTAEDASTETDEVEIDLIPSTNDEFAVLSGSGAAWGEMRVLTRTILPPVDLTDLAEANTWTISPSVEVAAHQIGGTRIVDMVIFETPYQAVYESDDTEWASHIFGTGTIDAETNAASNRPRERRSETSPDGNPRGGTRQTMAVAREQRLRLAPMLLHWGHYQEATSTYSTGLSYLERTGSSSNLVGLFDSSQTDYDADREGLSVSCGGYARDYLRNNGHVLGAEDTECAVPVRWRVYGNTTGSTVEIRLMVSDEEWVSMVLTSTEGWQEGWGYMRVGLNPSDPMVAQVFVNGNRTVRIYAMQLEVWPT